MLHFTDYQRSSPLCGQLIDRTSLWNCYTRDHPASLKQKTLAKFNKEDREFVVGELERLLGTQFFKVRPHQKVFRDKGNTWYCINGGTGSWHGITESTFQDVLKQANEARLVVAVKFKDRIEVYWGDMHTLIENRDRLSFSKKRVYQYTFRITGSRLCIKEVDNYCLNLEFTLSYPESQL